jgi:hypothetical protein
MAHISPEVERIIQNGIVEWKVPGLAIAVIQGDEIFAKVTATISFVSAST